MVMVLQLGVKAGPLPSKLRMGPARMGSGGLGNWVGFGWVGLVATHPCRAHFEIAWEVTSLISKLSNLT